MENSQLPVFSVSDFVASTNQTLEYAYPSVVVEGEVESFKINQGKFVFFTLKDKGASVGCFMMAFALRVPLEDGMRVVVRARPKLTNFGKFSLTIDTIKPIGEGSIKKGFELLKAQLETEGLFAPERKRPLPSLPRIVGIISSVQSAGYIDFMKIADERWGGVTFKVYHTTVQGIDAPDAIIQAIEYFNQLESPVDVLVVVRGGGSADDLSAFNDERLVRALAASRTPTLVGVGHEIDVTLSDLVADVRAATPSNAAQLLLPDKQDVAARVRYMTSRLTPRILQLADMRSDHIRTLLEQASNAIGVKLGELEQRTVRSMRLLESYNPSHVLARGYALVRGEPGVGQTIEVETSKYILTAEVTHYDEK